MRLAAEERRRQLVRSHRENTAALATPCNGMVHACSTRSQEGVSASAPLSAACSLLARPKLEKSTKIAT
eukprot:scaffold22646_cov68-Phaeocystis_antarctica.AAC.11